MKLKALLAIKAGDILISGVRVLFVAEHSHEEEQIKGIMICHDDPNTFITAYVEDLFYPFILDAWDYYTKEDSRQDAIKAMAKLAEYAHLYKIKEKEIYK